MSKFESYTKVRLARTGCIGIQCLSGINLLYFGWTTSSNLVTSSYISWGLDIEDIGDERIIARRQWERY